MSKNTQPYKFRVVRHRFNPRGGSAEPLDLMEFITTITIHESLQQPWNMLQLVMSYPRPRNHDAGNPFAANSPIVNGDWVVIYDDGYFASRGRDESRAIFWGYVAKVKGGIRALPNGAIESKAVAVTVIGWFDLLGRCRIQKAPGVSRSVGGLLGPDSWDKLFKGLTGSVHSTERNATGQIRRRDVGKNLKDMLKVVGVLQLPTSLGGGSITEKQKRLQKFLVIGEVLYDDEIEVSVTRPVQLGDQISTVHDTDSRDQFAPNLIVDPVPGWSIRGILAFNQRSATALQLILGTFGADPNMVELYPSLAEPGILPEEGSSTQEAHRAQLFIERFPGAAGAAGAVLTPDRGEDIEEDIFTIVKEGKQGKPGKAVGAGLANLAGKASLANETAKALGANPVLVYRMRPWREEQLIRYTKRNDTIGGGRKSRIDDDVFQGISWRANRGAVRTYTASDIVFMDYEWDDMQHVNCVTVGLPTQPDSDIKWIERAGLPLKAPGGSNGGIITQRGLRIFEPVWPFFPPFQDDQTSLMDSLVTVAVQAAQFMGAADKFAMGKIEMRFDSSLRPGMFIDVTAALKGSDVTLSAYVESVEHTISVNQKNGNVKARTVATYSRGLFDEKVRDRGRQFQPISASEQQ